MRLRIEDWGLRISSKLVLEYMRIYLFLSRGLWLVDVLWPYRTHTQILRNSSDERILFMSILTCNSTGSYIIYTTTTARTTTTTITSVHACNACFGACVHPATRMYLYESVHASEYRTCNTNEEDDVLCWRPPAGWTTKKYKKTTKNQNNNTIIPERGYTYRITLSSVWYSVRT